MMATSVVVLQIFFSYDRELCPNECRAIERRLGGKPRAVMHDKRHLAYVLVTTETPSALLDRLGGVLDVDAVTNYWAFVPTANVASKYGGFDSLKTAIDQAYALVYRRSKPKQVTFEPTAYKRRNHRAA